MAAFTGQTTSVTRRVTIKQLIAGLLFALCSVSGSAQENVRGILVAANKATLSSELAARVVALPKKMGQTFNKGDSLIRLDCRLFEAQLKKVDAEATVAQVKFDNTKQLNQLNSIGTLDVAIAQADLQKVQAERTIARLNVERCDIKAPFDGAVEQLDIHTFEVVQQHQPLMKVVGRKHLEAEIIVPAKWVTLLVKNKAITLQVEETEQSLEALVSYIGPSVDPASQTVQIRASIKKVPAKVLPGMSVLAVF